jgi:hypothetical protein
MSDVWYIHIDRGVIDGNRKRAQRGETEMLPPVTIKRGKRGRSIKAFRVQLPAGCEVVYTPETGEPLLPCGARLVITSPEEPTVLQ